MNIDRYICRYICHSHMQSMKKISGGATIIMRIDASMEMHAEHMVGVVMKSIGWDGAAVGQQP